MLFFFFVECGKCSYSLRKIKQTETADYSTLNDGERKGTKLKKYREKPEESYIFIFKQPQR